MAAGALLDGQRAQGSFSVHGDVVKELVAGLREIFPLERPSGFFPGHPALDGGRDHSNGSLYAQHFEEVGVGDQRMLVEMEGFRRDGDLLQFREEAVHRVRRER